LIAANERLFVNARHFEPARCQFKSRLSIVRCRVNFIRQPWAGDVVRIPLVTQCRELTNMTSFD
jgi:hypothetical protein